MFLHYSRTFNPTSTHEGAGYAAASIGIVLLVNAIVLFIIGLIIKIVNYSKSK